MDQMRLYDWKKCIKAKVHSIFYCSEKKIWQYERIDFCAYDFSLAFTASENF